MKITNHSALIGALIADSFSLPVDGIKSGPSIYYAFNHYENIIGPIDKSNYQGFKKGTYSKYGIQILIVMDFLEDKETLSPLALKKYWINEIANYKEYVIFYKKILRKLNYRGSLEGFNEKDLGYLTMMIPAVIKDQRVGQRELRDMVRCCQLFDQSDEIQRAAPLFYHLLRCGLKGKPPSSYLKKYRRWDFTQNKQMINLCFTHLNEKPQQLLKYEGQMSPSDFDLMLILFIILKYENNYKEAIIQNVLLGGRSTFRAGLIGMVIGSYNLDTLPATWYKQTLAVPLAIKWVNKNR